MRAAAVLAGLVVFTLVGASSAMADAPLTWDEGEGRSTLDTLIVFGGSTVGLFVLIVLFALVTARNNYVPPAPSTDIEPASDNSPAHH